MQISLSKALKLKNRIIGELNQVKEIILRENSQQLPTTSTVDVKSEYATYLILLDKLVKLKTKIAVANVGIYEKILKMAELKSTISFVQGIDTTDLERLEAGYGDQPIKRVWRAAIKKEDVDNIKHQIQIDLGILQDEIDEYNASTKIEWE